MTEKAFFRRVGEKFSAPNVFVLFNRWDCVDEEDDSPIERVRQQHIGTGTELLVDQLGADPASVQDRIFFVSSKEVLKVRAGTQSSGSDRRSSSMSPATMTEAAVGRLRSGMGWHIHCCPCGVVCGCVL